MCVFFLYIVSVVTDTVCTCVSLVNVSRKFIKEYKKKYKKNLN